MNAMSLASEVAWSARNAYGVAENGMFKDNKGRAMKLPADCEIENNHSEHLASVRAMGTPVLLHKQFPNPKDTFGKKTVQSERVTAAKVIAIGAKKRSLQEHKLTVSDDLVRDCKRRFGGLNKRKEVENTATTEGADDNNTKAGGDGDTADEPPLPPPSDVPAGSKGDGAASASTAVPPKSRIPITPVDKLEKLESGSEDETPPTTDAAP